MRKLIAISIIVLLIFAIIVESRTRGKQSDSQYNTKREHTVSQQQYKLLTASQQQYKPHYLTPDQPQFWWNCLLAAFLGLAGGFFSGMTVGLNSLSMLNLQILQRSSNPRDKRMANRILGVVKDHHLFLTTLLVGNAIVLESLPLVVHLIMPDWAAILVSTFIVLIVAEVVPMSWSTGTHKYTIAYYGAPLVKIMIILFWPICYPIARGLDHLLGKQHEERILRRDFLTFINDKRKNQLDHLEIEFINQVMNHSNKSIKDFMTPFDKLFMLQENQSITQKLIQKISRFQFSYILIYQLKKENVIGYVKTKQIILKYLKLGENNQPIKIQQLIKHKISDSIVRVYQDAIAIEALSIFQQYQTRVILVTDQQKHRPSSEKSQHSQISFYDVKQWVVKEQSKVIGLITLKHILYQIANYQIEAVKTSRRRLSQDSTGSAEPLLLQK